MSSTADSALPPPAAKATRRGGWSQRFDRWALARHPAGGSTRLTHRNVYILPTRTGAFFAVLLLVLLVLSINYQLNLGYLLTFLLAGSAMMAMHVTHNNLRGLQLTAHAPEGWLHQGQSARLVLLLQGGTRDRWGLALRPAGAPPFPPQASAKRRAKAPAPPYLWTHVDCGRDAEAPVTLSWTPPRRGLLAWPPLTVESQYPLGVWTAWSRWQPQGELLVLPAVEPLAPPLPPARPTPGNGPAVSRGGGETEGVRPWRAGDALRQVLWKKFARSDDLVSRDAAQPQARAELWLEFAALPASLDTEARLSRLCAWVLAADRAGMPYGLRLGSRHIPAATGAAHRAACLRLLALHPGPMLRQRRSGAPAQAGVAP